jgi:hypothetical protein
MIEGMPHKFKEEKIRRLAICKCKTIKLKLRSLKTL